jgi:hypothetical protein
MIVENIGKSLAKISMVIRDFLGLGGGKSRRLALKGF